MQHTQAWYRRTSAWVLALLMLASIGIVIGLVAPAPSVAKDRTLVVHARADATVFGRYPHRNFGNRPRLVVGAVPGGSRIYTTFAVPDLGDLVLDDATLVLRTLGHKHRIDVRRTGSHWHEMRITPANAPAGWRTLGAVARGRAHVMHLDVTDLVERSTPTLSLLLRTDGPRTVVASSESGHGPKIKIHGHVPEPTPTPTTTPTGSPDPSATATPTPTATGGGDLQPSLPIRAAFYYPWFPETWGPSSDRFTNYHPSLGWYDSSDVGVVSQHIAAMQYGGIQAGISSWWGQGTKTDQRVPTLLRAADGTTFRWSLYYEEEAQADPIGRADPRRPHLHHEPLRERSVVPADRRAAGRVRVRRRVRRMRHGLALGTGEHRQRLRRAEGVPRVQDVCGPARELAPVRTGVGDERHGALLLHDLARVLEER